MFWDWVVIVAFVGMAGVVLWWASVFKQWVRRMDTTPEDMRRADDGKQDPWPPQFGLWVDPPKR